MLEVHACLLFSFFIAILSLDLQKADLILTGMPSGEPVNPGNYVSCTLKDMALGKTVAMLNLNGKLDTC